MQKVLIVEDSKLFTRLLTQAIENKLGLPTEAVPDMASARALLEEDPGAFFVSLLDLNLPDAPRGEIVDLVTEKGVPAIVFTAEFSDALRERMEEKKILDYVLKDSPTSLDYVVALIRRIHRNRETTVLVVDDSNSARTYIASLLQLQQFRVLTAADGTDALEALAENPDIQLVITDYQMPGMDGFELIKAIRARFKKKTLAIIGVSALGSNLLSARFIKNGANDFLTKPFLVEEFFCRINQNLDMLAQIVELKELNGVKNRFLGMAAHDLRNPLTSLSGMAKMLSAMELDDATKDKFHANMVRVSDQMLGLVNDLLDVSVIESGRFEVNKAPNDLSQVAEERAFIIEMAAKEKGIDLELALEDLPAAPFDADRIGQVIDNLLTNAVKFSEPGTAIRLATQADDFYVDVEVTDQGPGIDKEDQKRLFGAFEKLAARPTGNEKSTGLGMAIVKKVVDAHEGRITVNSTLGKGSTFIISLPRQ